MNFDPSLIALFSRKIIRYDIAIKKYDVIGCAKVINELKIYFDGTLDNSKEKKKETKHL